MGKKFKKEGYRYTYVMLEKTSESPWDFKEIKQVNPKRNQPWIFIGRTDTEAEAPMLGPPDVKHQFIGKNSDARKDWRQKEKKVTEDKMNITDSMDMNLSKLWEIVEDKGAWWATAHGVTKSWTWLSDWITTEQQWQ